ncbi:hypothetical protein DPMN_166275 [Dreissena polymorpha]|uniref:Uncharacterized protein n=1 Tax=Dreissena polymorpha TaxID=45954 RepID=A0A9D4EZ67_DREPO|nr:hypothetical protein DPMN_166275 [Dreissena polymorpha]
MEHIEIKDLNSSHQQKTTKVELPSVSIATSSLAEPKSSYPKILVQKRNSGNLHNMPLPGHEYDFRRTLDHKRSTPRKLVSGRVRPHVPPDTLDVGGLRLDESQTFRKRRHTERLDVARIATPAPIDHDLQAQDQLTENISIYYGHTTYRTTVGKVDDLEEFADDNISEQFQMENIRKSVVSKPFKEKYDVIGTDTESARFLSPSPGPHLGLTEDAVNFYFQRPLSKDSQIAKWLVELDQKANENKLPAHLPDISASHKNVSVVYEDTI